MAEIIEITRQREASIRSARITWTETRLTTADKLKHVPGALPDWADVQSPPYSASLYMSGRKLLHERRLRKHPGSGFRALITGFDGEVDWGFGGISDGKGVPEGLIRGSTEYIDIEMVTIRAWTLYVRPMHALIWNPSTDTYAIETADVLLNDRPCTVVRERAGVSGDLRRRLWLDRQRKYVVVRSTQESKGQVGSLVNIDYREHPEFGWIPAKWDTAWYGNDGKLYDATQATLTDAQFNSDLAAELFSPHFPAGTKVYDERQDGRAFYALGNGELRPYTRADERGTWSFPVPGWTVAAIVFVGLTILLLWRWRRLQAG